MIRQIRALPPLLLSAALLTGCGGEGGTDSQETGSSPSETATSSPSGSELPATDFGKPAAGPKMKGDGYTYRLPKGWVNATRQTRARQSSVDSSGTESNTTDDFVDTLVIGFDSAAGATLDQLEQTVPVQLSTLVKKVETLPRVTVDGVGAIHHRGAAELGSTKFFLDQFATLDEDGRIAIITFSVSRSLPEKDRARLINSVMATWAWTD